MGDLVGYDRYPTKSGNILPIAPFPSMLSPEHISQPHHYSEIEVKAIQVRIRASKTPLVAANQLY
jgi:hypothetical protein